MRDRDRWGEPGPLYVGDALVDLHNGAGTPWRRDELGRYWPDCDCHRPKALTAPPEAAQAQRPEPAPFPVRSPLPDAIVPKAVIAAEAQHADAPVNDERGMELLTRWVLRRRRTGADRREPWER